MQEKELNQRKEQDEIVISDTCCLISFVKYKERKREEGIRKRDFGKAESED